MTSYHAWLQQVVAPYADPGRTFKDIDISLSSFQFLRPKTDHFTRLQYPQGNAPLLICLFGSITCGIHHNVPIEVWFPRGYPFESVYAFVIPSPGVQLKPNQYVDPQGKIYHPYLSQWSPRGNSNVVTFLSEISNCFTRDLPFFHGSAHSIIHSPSNVNQPLTSAPNIRRPEDNVNKMRELVREKIDKRFRELQTKLSLESESLIKESNLLYEGEIKLKEGIDIIKSEINRTELQIESTRKTKSNLVEIANKETDGEEVIDYSKIVLPHGPVASQIIDLVSTDLAISDTIIEISLLFGAKSSLDLQTFLKCVRELARKQFLNRALLVKIRRKFPVVS